MIHNTQKDGKRLSTPEELSQMWKMYYHTLFHEKVGNTCYDQKFKLFADSIIYKLEQEMDQRIDTMLLFDDPFTGSEVQLMCY